MCVTTPVHVDYLPDEIIQTIFLHVCRSEGHVAILKLSLVCRRWQRLVGDEIFRKRVHFSWLSTAYDWQKASHEFKETYYVMYDIRECLECNGNYKDVPGFMMTRGFTLSFHSDSADAGHPGFSSQSCAINSGTYEHPLDNKEP